MTMAKLNFIFSIISLLFLLCKINQFCYARALGNPTPTHPHNHYNHPKIKFLMQNTLNVTHPSPTPMTPKFPTQIPFPKPRGYFPPKRGIPLLQSSIPTGSSMKTFDFSSMGVSFPVRSALEELEFGSVIKIDEHLFEGTIYDSLRVGKAQGIFVASSENGISHMVAMTAKFGRNELKDGLRFFGVYKRDVAESHIAVIGGIGKFQDANGYAVIKAIDGNFTEENITKKLLSFNVYLS